MQSAALGSDIDRAEITANAAAAIAVSGTSRLSARGGDALVQEPGSQDASDVEDDGTGSWLVTNLADQLKDVKDDHYVVQLRVFGGELVDGAGALSTSQPALRPSLQWRRALPEIAEWLTDPTNVRLFGIA